MTSRDLKQSYILSELPDNLMLSPKFFFDWWDGVTSLYGGEASLSNKSPDFKLARELWVASVFAVCMRLSSNKEHWISAVSDIAPDALVAYFDIDDVGANRQIYLIEVTEFDDNSTELKATLKKKLDKAYDQTTRIICYMTRKEDHGKKIDLPDLMEFVKNNNPRGYEVWILGGFVPKKDVAKDPQKLFCLTSGADYQIDLGDEKLETNTAEAVWVPDEKSTNKSGELRPLGKIKLSFPVIE